MAGTTKTLVAPRTPVVACLVVARLVVACLIGALALAGCASTYSGGGPAQGEVPRTVKLGSTELPPGDQVLRSDQELQELWSRAGIKGTPPSVDWSQEMVLLTARGCLPDSCYRTRITRFTRSGREGQAWVEDIDPSPRCRCATVITCPFHLVRVPRVEGEIEFRHRRVAADCPVDLRRP